MNCSDTIGSYTAVDHDTHIDFPDAVKAVEAVVDVLGHQRVQAASAPSRYGYRNSYGFDEDEER